MNFRIWPLINVMAWLGFELLYLLANPKCAQNMFQGEMIPWLPHSEAKFCFFSKPCKSMYVLGSRSTPWCPAVWT